MPRLTWNFFTALAFLGLATIGSPDRLLATAPSPSIDLAVTMTDTPDPAGVGTNVTYSILVTNAGPSAATGVVLSNILSGPVTPIGVTVSQGGSVIQGSEVNCFLGAINAGSSAMVSIVVQTTAPGTITNNARASATESDANPSNNSATATTSVGTGPPTITAQPESRTNNIGTTATFSVSATGAGPLRYQWYFNTTNALSTQTNATLILPNVQTNQRGGYRVVVTNSFGSSTSVVAFLTVTVPPFITQQPVSLTVTQNNNAIFNVTAGGDAPLSYQWRLNGGSLTGATNSSHTVVSAQASHAGNYDVIVTNNYGSRTSAVATLTVLVPPSITQQPASLTVATGEVATFTVVASGTAPLIYQWRYNGADMAGKTNATLTISNSQPSDAGTYTVRVSNNIGTVTSDPATLTVSQSGFPTITVQPKNRTVIEGTNHTFGVTATGQAPLRYQWRFNGVNLAGSTNSTLPLTNIQTSHAGPYHVVVTNTSGAVTSVVAILTVRRTNDPVYSNPDGGWTYVYAGNAASNSLTAGLDGTWNRQNGSDSWGGDARGPGNAPLGGVGTANSLLTIEDAVLSGSGSTDNRRFYFTHNLQQELAPSTANTLLNDGVTLSFRTRLTPPPPADPFTELTNAPNGYVNVFDGRGMFGLRQAGGSGMIVSFTLNQASEDTNASGTTLDFGQAGLHMNNLNGDSRSPSVDPGEGGTINLLPLNPTVFHEFWITIQDNGATAGTHRVSIYMDGSKTASVFNLTAGIASDTPSTNYLGMGLPNTAQRGAYDIDFFAYKPGLLTPSGFNDPVGIVLQPTNQTIAAGQTATFNVGVTGTPPFAYQWYRNGGAISNATNSSYTTPPVTSGDNGAAFTVVISNVFNYVTSSPPALLLLLQSPTILAQPQSLTVTNGDPASFAVTAQSATPASYQWRFNGANLTSATNSSLNIASASPGNAGNYDVIVSNSAGAVTSAVAILTVKVLDFGDAPGLYLTLLVDNGARHVISSGIRLGAGVDIDLDGQPDASATGDDLAGSDDEDGVAFTTPLRAGQMASVDVVASTNGLLNAWIDFHGDGSWATGGDQIFTNRILLAGTNHLSFLVAPSATPQSTFVRFRFSTAGGSSFAGPAADGEVEDYAVVLTAISDLVVTNLDSPDPVALNSNLVYTITVFNAGPSIATGVTLMNTLPGNVNFLAAIPSQGACTNSAGTVTCNMGSLSASSGAVVTVTVSPTATGFLTNTATAVANELDLFSANNTALATTEVQIAPSITSQPVSVTVLQGNNATFSVTAAGTAPLSYQWRLGGSDLSGKTNSSLTISNAQVSDAGAYTVRVSNRVGQVLSAPATLTVLGPPAITQQPQSRTNTAGSQATLSVAATGTEPLHYRWFFNATNLLAGATSATLSLTNVQKTQTGDYTVVITNSAGAVTSVVARLTVFEIDFGDAPTPAYPTLLANNGARHRVVAGFRLGLLLDFEPDGQPNAAATGDDLGGVDDDDGVSFLTPLLVGQPVNIAVNPSANGLLNAWIDFNANGSWSEAGEQILTNRAVVAGTNFFPFVVPATALAANTYARFRFSSAGGLSFTGEALDGEVEDYAVTISPVSDLQLVLNDQPDPLVLGSNLTYALTVTNRGPSSASGVILSNTLPAGVSFVSVATSQGSCSNASGLVRCVLGSLAAGSAASVSIVVTPATATTITNTASVSANETDLNLGNNTALAVTAVLEHPVILSQPQSRTITNGNNVTFSVTATGTALRYQWRFNGTNILNQTNAVLALINVQPSQAGSYSVQVTNAVGAVLSEPAILTVVAPVQITTQPQSQTAVVGSTVTFSVTAAGSPPLTYQWYFNSTELPGETQPTLTIDSAQLIHEGTYTVRVSNSAESVLSAPATLNILESPIITQQPQSATNFAGGLATLAVTAEGTAPLRYQWYLNATNVLANATNAMLAFPNVQKTQTGNYQVVVTNSAGAVTSVVARLTILEMDFGDAPDIGYPTLLAFGGARHEIVPGVRLGASVDFEPDGQPDPIAQGDDNNGTDDEGGVAFTTPVLVGQTAGLQVSASTNGFLDGWIDFNRNGTWDDPGEQVFTSQLLAAGGNILSFSVPVTAAATNTFARFRFSSAGGLGFDGPAPNGEVEDYQLAIGPAIDLALTLLDNPDPVTVGSNLTYTIAVTNQGASTANGVTVTHVLPASASFVSAVTTQGSCTNQSGILTCQLGALASAGQASIFVQLVPRTPGVFASTANVTANELELNPANNVAQQETTAVAWTGFFGSSQTIVAPDNATASPYPSTILVSGVTATVYKAVVTLSNLTHTFPSDLDILLVGPGGQSVLLMSDAGAGRPGVVNVVLAFDDDSPLIIPESGFFVSETYRPSNYGSGADPFAAPAPAGPYGSQLSVFRGTAPNGIWSLYVVDDEVDDFGEIRNGWSLTFATLNPIADLRVTQRDVPDPVAVGGNLTYTVTVTNSGLAGASGVVLTNRLPAGVNLVSVTASQGSCTNQGGIIRCALGQLPNGASAAITIVATALTPGTITNVATVAGNEIDFNLANNVSTEITSVTRPVDVSLFMIRSPEPVGLNQNVTYTLLVTNHGPNQATGLSLANVLPAGVSFLSANASQGGCTNSGGTVQCDLGALAVGARASVSIVGRADAFGIFTNRAQILPNEIDLNIANNSAAQITTVVAFFGPFVNAAPITIPPAGAASPFPSSILVSGAIGKVHQVSVTLSNLSHGFADDLDILLVSPNGQAVLFMSDAGGSSTVNATLKFEDTASISLPDSSLISSGTFKPTAFDPNSDLFSSPAPAGPYATNFSFFNGGAPNGLWSLYVSDDGAGVSGGINGGWSLTIATLELAPIISNIPDQTVDEDMSSALIAFTVQDGQTPPEALTLGRSSSDTVLIPNENILLGGSGSNRTVRIIPAANRFGSATITITVTDTDGASASDMFLVTVNSVNDRPFLSDIAAQMTGEDTVQVVPFMVGDIETAAGILSVSASSSNPLLVTQSGLLPGGSESNRQVTISPVTNQFGTAIITITVTDLNGGSTNKSFLFTVHPVNDPPTLNAISNRILDEDASEQEVVLSGVTSGPANESQTLAVTAVSDRPDLIPHPNVSYISPTWLLNFTPAANAVGMATITVTVDDGGATNRTVSRQFTVTLRPVNDLPMISDIADRVTDEDTPVGPIPFTIGDFDTNAAALLVIGASSHPALVANTNIVITGGGTNRSVTVTPSPNAFGTATITLSVSDPEGGTVVDTFVVTVNSVNDAPTLAEIGNVSIDENAGPQTVMLGGISSGASNETQVLTVTASSSNPGVIPDPVVVYGSPNSTGKLILAPIANTNGSAVITVSVNDGQGQNNVTNRTFVVTVRRVNDLPAISVIPNQATDEDTPKFIAFTIGDAETSAGSLTIAGSSSNQALVPNGNLLFGGSESNPTLTITPTTNQFGTTTIAIVVTDADTGTVTRSFVLTVNPLNDAPGISDLADLTIGEDRPTGPIAFRVDDAETPRASLLITGQSSNPLLVPSGSIVFGGSDSNRTVNITPVTNRFGSATITITVRDADGRAASDSFLLTVSPTNDAPVISDIADRTMVQNTSLAIAFVVSDVDSALDSLQISGTSSNPTLLTNPVVGGSGANRMITLTPGQNQSGTATITVTVTDTSGASASDTFLLTVIANNQPPTLNAINPLVINEDAGQQTVLLTGIGPGASNEIQTVTLMALSSNPALIPTPGISYTNPSSTGVLTFTAASNATGTAAITVTVDDGQPDNHSFSRSFTVTVNPVNDAPSILSVTNRTTNEDTPVTVPFTVGDSETLLSLTLIGTSSNTALVANTNILFSGSGSNRTATILPTANQSGTTTITLAVNDGAATNSTSFVLTVMAVNDPPTLDPLPDIVRVESPVRFTINLTGITSGATNESQTLTVTAVSSVPADLAVQGTTYTSPSSTGSFDLRPSNNATGVVTITVTVNDNQATNNTVSQSFAVYSRPAANALPTISAIANHVIDEDTPTAAIPFVITDSSTPATLLIPAGRSSNTNLLPNGNIVFGGSGSNRTVTLTPAANQSGATTITLSVTDTNFGVNSTSFVLTVNPVNDLPTISSLGPQTTLQNTPIGPIAFVIGDVETPAGSLAVAANSSNSTLVPNTNIVVGGTGTDRAVLITPASNQSGTANITISVTDGDGGSTNRTFALTVIASNNLPLISDIADQTISQGTATAALAFTVQDLETPPDSLALAKTSSNQALVPEANILFGGSGNDRTVTVTPAANQSGTTTITITVTDANGGAASDSFVLTVVGVNQPPTLDAIADRFLNEGSSPQIVTLTGISSGTANESQVLALSATSSNPDLIPTPAIDYTSPAGTGTMSLAPLPGTNGTATITVTVNDGQSQSNLFSRDFTVTVNAAPVISDLADQVIDEDTSLGPIAFTVHDLETAASDLTITTNSSNPVLVPLGNITLGGSGTNRTVTVRPATNQFGNTTITLTVMDTNGNTSSDSFVLVVNPINDLPTLDAMTNVVLLEDAAPRLVNLSGIGSGAANEPQPLMLFAVSSAPALLPDPVVDYTSPNSSGSLILTPLPGAQGAATITVTVHDGQSQNNSTSQVFTVTVMGVNDPPTLDTIDNVTIEEDAGLQIVQLTGISSGAPGENEALVVTASSSDPSLIPAPNITYTSADSMGLLRFAPTTNASGSAVISVRVDDAAGNNLTRAFTVTVNAVNDLPSISDVADQAINENTSTSPLAFIIGDAETAAINLTLNGHSSNPALVPYGNIQFGGAGSNRNVTVTPAVNQSGTAVITVTVADPQGNSASESFVLVVNAAIPTITRQPQSQIVAAGGTAIFRVTASSTSPLSYQWRRNGIDVPGTTNATLTIANVQAAHEGDYTVVVSNNRGSVASLPARLQLLSPPVITQIARGVNSVAISFTTMSGPNYTVEYRDSFSIFGWAPLLTVSGTGNVMTVNDVSASVPMRFYQVRAQ